MGFHKVKYEDHCYLIFYLPDLFFAVSDIDIASYAKANTPCMITDNVDDLVASLEQVSNGLFELFKRIFWKVNDWVSINVDGFKIDKSNTDKPLGVKFDKKLTFDDHIFDICKKPGRKISPLARVTPYMGIAKKCILMNAFLTS